MRGRAPGEQDTQGDCPAKVVCKAKATGLDICLQSKALGNGNRLIQKTGRTETMQGKQANIAVLPASGDQVNYRVIENKPQGVDIVLTPPLTLRLIHTVELFVAQQRLVDDIHNIGIDLRRDERLGAGHNLDLFRPGGKSAGMNITQYGLCLSHERGKRGERAAGKYPARMQFNHAECQSGGQIHAGDVETVDVVPPAPALGFLSIVFQGENIAQNMQVTFNGAAGIFKGWLDFLEFCENASHFYASREARNHAQDVPVADYCVHGKLFLGKTLYVFFLWGQIKARDCSVQNCFTFF